MCDTLCMQQQQWFLLQRQHQRNFSDSAESDSDSSPVSSSSSSAIHQFSDKGNRRASAAAPSCLSLLQSQCSGCNSLSNSNKYKGDTIVAAVSRPHRSQFWTTPLLVGSSIFIFSRTTVLLNGVCGVVHCVDNSPATD